MCSIARETLAAADEDAALQNDPAPRTGFRWVICALIFFAATVNYLDRQLFSVLVPIMEKDKHLRLAPIDLAFINSSFVACYGVWMLFMGRLIDRVGIKLGLGVSYVVWSVASFLHAFVGGAQGLSAVRGLLGIGEAAAYPTGIKTVSEWFPIKERATATGIFNGGANFGAILAPLLGVWLATQYGWRACFMITGVAGTIWLFFWQRLYRPPVAGPGVSQSEIDYIRADQPIGAASLTIRELLSMPSVYGLAIAKALTDGPFWFYLFWMPKFLVDQLHLKTGLMALAMPIIYVVADLGSITGGWSSSALVKNGVPVRRARGLVMLTCAALVLPVIPIGWVADQKPPPLMAVYFAVAAVALASGAHQGWSSNLFTVISDSVPTGSTAAAVGLINGSAMLGVVVMQMFVGIIVQRTNSYALPFLVAGTLYLVAYGVLQLFLPRVRSSPSGA